MTQSEGPWRRRQPPQRRWLAWLAILGAGALVLWELTRLFPGSLGSANDQIRLTRGVLLLALLGSGVVFARQFTWQETARNIAIWAGIAAVLVFGYTFYQQISDVALDARSHLVPGYPTTIDPHTMVLREDRDGDYIAIGQVNGVAVKFLVDTGASDIVLSPGDAERVGVNLSSLRFNRTSETANGEGHGAAYTVDTLTIGDLTLFNIPVSINQAPMNASLLGMDFLKRMKSFEMRNHRLYLRWR